MSKERSLVQNASDPEQVREAGKRISRQEAFQRADLKHVMSSPEGQRLLWRIILKCGVFEISYREEPLSMAYLEGHRNIGLMLMDWIKDVDEAMIGKMSALASEENVV